MDDGVEFLDGSNDDPDPGEDLLDTGPHRPIPRWTVAAVGLCVAAAVVAGLTIGRHNDRPHPIAAPTSHGSSSGPATRPSPAHPFGVYGSAGIVAPPTGAARLRQARPGGSLAFVPQRSYDAIVTAQGPSIAATAFLPGGTGIAVLTPGQLALLPAGRPSTRVVVRPVAPEIGDPALGPWHLAAVGDTVWVVGDGVNLAYAFDARTLAPDREVPVDVALTGLAVLDGHVYVSGRGGLYELGPGSTVTRAFPHAPVADQIVADPTRHRLLLLRFGYGTRAEVTAFWPGQPRREQVTAELPFWAGQLVVAGDAIWASGSVASAAGNAHAGDVTVRLDPTTLRALPNGRMDSALADARVVAAGSTVVWFRPSSGRAALWCVSASTGRILQRWPDVSGQVVSETGAAFIANGASARRLPLARACRG